MKTRDELILKLRKWAEAYAYTTAKSDIGEDWSQEALLHALSFYDKFKEKEEAELLKIMNKLIVNKIINLSIQNTKRKKRLQEVYEPFFNKELDPFETAMLNEILQKVLKRIRGKSHIWLRDKWDIMRNQETEREGSIRLSAKAKLKLKNRIKEQLRLLNESCHPQKESQGLPPSHPNLQYKQNLYPKPVY